MSTTEEKLHAKIPGEDTGIITRNSFCDVCAPGPHCGVTCYVKDGKIIKVEGTDGHPTNHGLLCPKGQANRQYVYRKDRIMTPLRRVGERGEGKFEPITWMRPMTRSSRASTRSNRTMAPAPWPSTPATTSGTAPFSSGCAMTSAP